MNKDYRLTSRIIHEIVKLSHDDQHVLAHNTVHLLQHLQHKHKRRSLKLPVKIKRRPTRIKIIRRPVIVVKK